MSKTTRAPKFGDLVSVSWVDIFSYNESWTDLKDWVDPGEAISTTAGYLLSDLKDGYVVTAGTLMTLKGDTYYHDVSYFPQEVVRKITIL